MSSLADALIRELDDAALDALAERLAPRIARYLALGNQHADEWLDARRAAAYLGLTTNALHKLTAARRIPFEQDGSGCKLWFRRSELDRWRRGGGLGRHTTASKPLPSFEKAPS